MAVTLKNLKILPQTGSHAYTKLLSDGRKGQHISSQQLNDYDTKYPHVEHMEIQYHSLKSIAELASFPCLKWLNVSHNELTEFDLNVQWNIDTNTGNKSLITLDLSRNQLTNLGALGQHIHLEVLDLAHNHLESIAALSSLQLLKQLNIEHNHISDLSPLRTLHIAELNAAHNNLTELDDIFAESIRILNVSNNNISNLNCCTKFHQLTEFYVGDNNISDLQQLDHLAKLALLRQLDVKGNAFQCIKEKDLELQVLWILPDLQYLNGHQIGAALKIEAKSKHHAFDEQLLSIQRYYTDEDANDELETEKEFWCRMVERGFAVCWERFIDEFPTLSAEHVDLSNIKIGNAGLHSLCDSIQQCSTLTTLVLRGCLSANRWSDTKSQWPLKYLCDTLLINDTLKVLDLSHCCIDAVKFEPLSYLIEHSSSLSTLNLSHNYIGQHVVDKHNSSNIIKACPAIQQLSASVIQSKSQSLSHLFLSDNQIDSFGAYSIGQCLQSTCCKLRVLDISHNPLTRNGNGMGEIAKFLKANMNLTTFDMSYCIENKRDSEFMEQIFHSLKENTCLRELDISGNVLSKHAMQYLAIAMMQNQSIQAWKIKDVFIEQEPFHSVMSALIEKHGLLEFVAEIQSASNLDKILNSLSHCSNLQCLRLTHAPPHAVSNDQLQLRISEQSFSALTTLHLSKLPISSECVCEILQVLCHSNGSLLDLNIECAQISTACLAALTKLCDVVSLERLSLDSCAIDADYNGLAQFFESRAISRSLRMLNMANVEWMSVEPLQVFSKLSANSEASLDDIHGGRAFTLNLSKVPLHASTIRKHSKSLNQFVRGIASIGVSDLVLDHFRVVNDEDDADAMNVAEICTAIFECFSKRTFTTQSLSIKHEVHGKNVGFIDAIPLVRLRHISLPKLSDIDSLTRLLHNVQDVKTGYLETLLLGNEVNEEQMQLTAFSGGKLLIQIPEFGNMQKESMDRKVNEYVNKIAFSKCCKE
eukprot:CAMPEP_0197040142 /NCGR_PEP_ID=MMETSP1384-20130603/16892_1 /TAXON_ID=29189 /ORGANISM="Ammonia sp." /LENGTH=984 /DNA_ID=CAMNT_0042470853 /DNA_START=29 /DNA_END=2983 /DNA_ORIENTATION=-